MSAPARTPAYELGRARGACYGRTEPTEADWEWLCCQPDMGEGGELNDRERGDFEDGMLDGAEQMQALRLGLPCSPPSPEAIAAARDPK